MMNRNLSRTKFAGSDSKHNTQMGRRAHPYQHNSRKVPVRPKTEELRGTKTAKSTLTAGDITAASSIKRMNLAARPRQAGRIIK